MPGKGVRLSAGGAGGTSDWSPGSWSRRPLAGLPAAWRLAPETGSESYWSGENLAQKLPCTQKYRVTSTLFHWSQHLWSPPTFKGRFHVFVGREPKKQTNENLWPSLNHHTSHFSLFPFCVSTSSPSSSSSSSAMTRNVGTHFSVSDTRLSVSATEGGGTTPCSQEKLYVLRTLSLRRRSPRVWSRTFNKR